MRSTAVLLLAFGLFGCGSDPVAPGTDGGPPIGTDAPARPDAPVPPTDTVTLSFGPHPLAIGDERTVCIVLDAGNDVERQVRTIRTHLPEGSHHMIVYRTDEPVRTTPVSCFPFADGGQAVFIAETREAELTYPPDAALTFEPHQHVKLEIHEVNYVGEPLDVTADVTFDYYEDDGTTRSPVQFLFTGNMALALPAHEVTTVESFHAAPSDARIFGITSHTHSLGTHASIHRGTSASDYTDVLHESNDWANPALDTFEPPLELGAGEGLRLECTFDNTTDAQVNFGLDFADEMCFLWAYYY